MMKIQLSVALCIFFLQTTLNADNTIYNKTDGTVIINMIYQKSISGIYYPCPAASQQVIRIETKSQAHFFLTKGECKAYKIVIKLVDGPNAGLKLSQDISLLDPNLCIYIENKSGTLTANQVVQE